MLTSSTYGLRMSPEPDSPQPDQPPQKKRKRGASPRRIHDSPDRRSPNAAPTPPQAQRKRKAPADEFRVKIRTDATIGEQGTAVS